MEFTGERSFPAVVEAVGRSVAWVREVAAAAELPPARSLHLELAIEETVANVVHHAYAGGSGEFRIRLSGDLGVVHVEVEDAGIPFDPTGESGAPADHPDERKAGGLGLGLIRRVTSRLSYRREDGLNRLSFDLTSVP